MFETLKNGGIIMIPIIACGVFAIYIIIERLIFNTMTKKKDAQLMRLVLNDIDRMDFSAAESHCIECGTPTAVVIRKAIRSRRLDEDHLKEIIQIEMDNQVSEFTHLLTALGTIASVATMLGLLGTVTGNIKAFGVLSGGGAMGDPAGLASSIAEALVTTVGGLIVSIPSVAFHNFFNNEVNHRITEMENNVTQVIYHIIGKEL